MPPTGVSGVKYRYGSRTVYPIEYHFVWVTKYRYKVLRGEVAERVRELVRQTCEAFEIRIVRGMVNKNPVRILVSVPPVKGRTSSDLFEEFHDIGRALGTPTRRLSAKANANAVGRIGVITIAKIASGQTRIIDLICVKLNL